MGQARIETKRRHIERQWWFYHRMRYTWILKMLDIYDRLPTCYYFFFRKKRKKVMKLSWTNEGYFLVMVGKIEICHNYNLDFSYYYFLSKKVFGCLSDWVLQTKTLKTQPLVTCWACYSNGSTSLPVCQMTRQVLPWRSWNLSTYQNGWDKFTKLTEKFSSIGM